MTEIKISNMSIYRKIAKDSYDKLKTLNENYKLKLEELGKLDNADVVGMQNQVGEAGLRFRRYLQGLLENIKSIKLEMRITSINIIIYSAIFLEAYIYDYCKRHLGSSFTKEHLEKIDTVSKLVIAFQLATKRKFPKSNNIYNKITTLFCERNKLVHNKSKTMSFEERVDYVNYIDNTFDALVNNSFMAYEALTQILDYMKDFDECQENI